MHRLLALDPGGTTGYALAVLESDRLYIYCGERKLTHRQLYYALCDLQPDWLICEDFYYRQRAGASVDFTPAELIGIIKLWAEPNNPFGGDKTKGHDVYFQNPSTQGKTAHFSDERLKNLGIYKKGTNHGRSAIKHLMHFIQFGPGYQLIIGLEPLLQLVEEDWLLGAYWDHIDPWS